MKHIIKTWIICGLAGLTVYSLFTNTTYAASIASTWAKNQIAVDGQNNNEWPHNSSALRLQRGVVQAQNNNQYLYLYIDLGGDTHQDKPKDKAPWGDFITISVDVNRDRKITPKVDVAFGQFPGTYNVGRQHYIESGAMTGLQRSKSEMAAGFGRSLSIPIPHRIWEVAIPLNEIGAKPGDIVRLGIHTYSERPSFSDHSPSYIHKDFDQFHEITLSTGLMTVKLLDLSKVKPLPVGVLTGLPAKDGGTLQMKPVQRSINAKGHVVLRYQDGKTIEKYPGGQNITMPDGQTQTILFSTQAPAAIPPSLPDDAEAKWLEWQSNSLMRIIRSMVQNDSEAIQHFEQYEGQEASVYEKINKRTTTINYLVTP